MLVRIGFLPAWDNVVDEADRPRVFAEVKARLNESRASRGTAHDRACRGTPCPNWCPAEVTTSPPRS